MTTEIYDSIAVRYRPHILSDMIGQDRVVSSLKGMFKSERISRTLLISGPWGSGKTTSARIIARYLNCKTRKPEEDPCEKCDSCKELGSANPSHRDYQEINAADSRGIEVIRSIIDQAKFKPQTNFRIFTLDEVHQLTPQAFQALLKILEEPPPSSIFILCTTELHRIPPAIVSRATKLLIQPVPAEATASRLRLVVDKELGEKAKHLSDAQLLRVAEAVHGHPRDALTTIESIINAILAAGKTDDLDSYIQKSIEESVSNSLESLVFTFLLAVYQGKYTSAIKAIQGAENHQAFMENVLKYHTQTIYGTVSPKLKDKFFLDWFSQLESTGILICKDGKNQAAPDPLLLSDMMNIFMKATTDLKSYLVDGFYTLLNAAISASSLTKRSQAAVKAQEPKV